MTHLVHQQKPKHSLQIHACWWLEIKEIRKIDIDFSIYFKIVDISGLLQINQNKKKHCFLMFLFCCCWISKLSHCIGINCHTCISFDFSFGGNNILIWKKEENVENHCFYFSFRLLVYTDSQKHNYCIFFEWPWERSNDLDKFGKVWKNLT